MPKYSYDKNGLQYSSDVKGILKIHSIKSVNPATRFVDGQVYIVNSLSNVRNRFNNNVERIDFVL